MLKVNMMCGIRNFGDKWYHVDKDPLPHIGSADIYLTNFADNSIDLIYCSHGIAYFDRKEIIPLLKSWLRVLKPGACLRLATPDLKEIARLYIRNRDSDKFLGLLYGKMGAPPIYHKTVYDYYSLSELLASVGYKTIRRYSRHLTDHARHDDHSAAVMDGVQVSLNLQCYKP